MIRTGENPDFRFFCGRPYPPISLVSFRSGSIDRPVLVLNILDRPVDLKTVNFVGPKITRERLRLHYCPTVTHTVPQNKETPRRIDRFLIFGGHLLQLVFHGTTRSETDGSDRHTVVVVETYSGPRRVPETPAPVPSTRIL